MEVTPAFTYDPLPVRVVFGVGAARSRLAAEVERLGMRRILVVASKRDRELAEELTAPLGGAVVATFTGVRPHVPVEVAEAASALADRSAADGVVCIGGGSATGTAKAVALSSGRAVVAVPTTYAGSEVTPVWGTTEGSRKVTGTDPRVLPRTAVYDPVLTTSLPGDLSAASGLNAMAHCIEAFWGPRSNPITSLGAEEGIRALAIGLPDVVADGADLAARSWALYGAHLAGVSFAVAGGGLHHKICHVLGGAYDLPHAQTHAVLLPYVLAYNAPAVPDVVDRVARALGGGGTVEGGDGVGALVHLGRVLGVPRTLREIGLPEDRLDEAAALVDAQLAPGNPRPVAAGDVRALLQAAWDGSELRVSAVSVRGV